MSTDLPDQAATTDATDAAEPTNGRRELFTKAGAAAAVAAVAGLAVSKSAEAANGDPLTIGVVNSGTATTRLSGGSSLYVLNGTSFDGQNSSIRGQATADDHNGVRGEASGSAGWGVYGISSGSGGRGVFGTNSGNSGIGVRGENSASGGFGVYGLNSAVGTDSAGAYGRNTGSGHGVWGLTTDPAGAGVYGITTEENGVGVYGNHDNSSADGIGVLGVSARGNGVVGRGVNYDVLADQSGRLGLTKAGHSGSASANGSVGTIARDDTGNLWYCYATNAWQQLTGSSSPTAFYPITPIRAYDSRIGAIPESGAFAANSSKVISIKDGRHVSTGAVDAANAVPSGATAVAFNVTATNTTGGSFLAVVPGNVASSAVSSLNWTGPGVSIANAGIVGIDGSRQVRIIAGPVGTFDAIIDITGYYK
jgi:hypothetical protein